MVMQYLRNVSILFADIVGFTKMSSNLRAIDIVNLLNIICHHFDRLVREVEMKNLYTALFTSETFLSINLWLKNLEF